MTDRERLIEIVRNSLIKHIDKSCCLAENIVDDLLTEGVTTRPVAFSDNRRERMIELLDGYYEETGINIVHYFTEEESEMLADYILADGWIRPHCKVGDMVYQVGTDGKIYESEYIERESLLKQANELAGGVFGTPRIIVAIKNAPKADVVEVKHGRWIYHEMVASYDGSLSGYSCSECSGFVDEEVFDSDEIHKSFCGCCGAKMDLKEGAEG